MTTAKTKFGLKKLTALLVLSGVVTHSMAQVASSDIGTVNIAGQGDELGAGYMIDDDSVKARSTVTKAAIDKAMSTSNPYQLLNLMPGVNASSYDSTGLFGGNLRIRGFNSDQIGFTINGAPVNDSGNFAVYPQEYTDSENLCEIFVTQGSADVDSPHVEASGGNIGIVSCGPKDQRGGKISESFGDLQFHKSFVRLDSGWLAGLGTKFFVSYSNAEANKFKGYGSAVRNHVDLGIETKVSSSTTLTQNLLYNNATNNNYMALTKAQFASNPNMDYSNVIPQHSATSDSTAFGTTYYGYSINPFQNFLYTSKLQTRIDEKLTLSAEPYYWFGYGTGGVEQTTLSTSPNSYVSQGGAVSTVVNPYGNSASSIGVYSGSVTRTLRPGITFKADWNLDNQKIIAGYWVERADQTQTKPATTVDNNGNIASPFLTSNLITLANGQLYENRNYNTISTASAFFVTDTITVNKQLDIIPGIKYTDERRNFTNYAANGPTSPNAIDYKVNVDYNSFLPTIGARFKLNSKEQIFGNVTEGMKAPGNFVLTNIAVNSSCTPGTSPSNVNGTVSGCALQNTAIQKETSTTTEGGYKFAGDTLNASATLFYTQFQNRIASSYNPVTATVSDMNVGSSTMSGLELQAGTKPVNGWSGFGSFTYTNSILNSDFNTLTSANAPITLNTTGRQFPDTPRIMAGAMLQYTTGPFLTALSAKYTGLRYSTLMNDESIGAYTTMNLDTGYRFESSTFLKSPTLRFNISNLTNSSYLIANSGSGSNITPTVNTTIKNGGSPSYYVGAPRFWSMSFTTEF